MVDERTPMVPSAQQIDLFRAVEDIHELTGAIVFLAGGDAYKIKRAVKFPFMDLSTLEKRRIACQAEVDVNKPNAPGIYIEAIPITRGPVRPHTCVRRPRSGFCG